MKNHFFLVLIVCLLIGLNAKSQSSTYIDNNGIMRYAKSNEEVCVFGTNYSVPFAYWDHRAPLIRDNHKKAIDEDVYHMARLGIDGFRIHIMESYIVDDEGNLVYNQHFELFDYLLFKLKERGIKMYITPMYLGEGNNPNSFTSKYGMGVGCLSNEKAFPAQENYLKQFVSHVNPLTGIAYKDDPDIIAFEIVNEPKHWKAPHLIKKYISKMYKAIRSTGCDKPLMYNMTTCSDFIDDVLTTEVDGGSFQWYPTGLTSNHVQEGNMLPNVDRYIIPFEDKLKNAKMPKFVYEFSPSDTKGAYMYPAMARSFREAGFQFAAHFSYDPLHAAHTNVEYKTHFLNLAYTPKKAIGLMIASEVFHTVPLKKSYGRFPENNQFESFNLSYKNDLAEMLTDEKFIYSNSTKTIPSNIKTLNKIVGAGNSFVVNYTGTGAYFLEKLEQSVWRLEVMPDAHWVKDPFFVPYTEGEVAVTLFKEQLMKIMLPDLGNNFSIAGINDGNSTLESAQNESFKITPGVYLLTKKGIRTTWKNTEKFNNIKLNEFYIPRRKLKQDYVLHQPPVEVSLGVPLKLSVKIISEKNPEQVELIVLKKGGGVAIPMRKVDAYNYEVELPEKYTKNSQIVRYHISYKTRNTNIYTSFPSGKKDTYLLDRRIYSDDMSLDEGKPYQTSVVEPNNPIYLFNATTDWESITKMNRKDNLSVYPSSLPNQSLLRVDIPKEKKAVKEFVLRFYCKDKIDSRRNDLIKKNKLSIYGKSNQDLIIHVQLLMKNGQAFGKDIKLRTNLAINSVLLKDLVDEKFVLLPRPYPKFQVYEFESEENKQFDITQLESIQISIQTTKNLNKPVAVNQVEIGWVSLE